MKIFWLTFGLLLSCCKLSDSRFLLRCGTRPGNSCKLSLPDIMLKCSSMRFVGWEKFSSVESSSSSVISWPWEVKRILKKKKKKWFLNVFKKLKKLKLTEHLALESCCFWVVGGHEGIHRNRQFEDCGDH